MSAFIFAPTSLTPAQQTAIPAGPYMPLLASEVEAALSVPPTERPRIYAFLEERQEIIRLASLKQAYDYSGLVSMAWVSNTTWANLVGRARSSKNGE